MFKIELINGTFIHFVSEFTQTICSLKNSERNLPFYTSNTLSWVCLWKFVQFGHFYRRFHIRKRRNSARKNCIEIPLLMKDQIYTRDCTKQTSKLPRLQKIDLLKNYFPFTDWSWAGLCFVYQCSIEVSDTFQGIIDCFCRKNCRDSHWT